MAMNNLLGQHRRARAITLTGLALAVAVPAFPAIAQQASPEARIQRLESEVRALQRKVFPGADGRYFTPEITPSAAPPAAAGQPATTPLTDVLSRMEALESQLTRLTSQVELNTNRLSKIEARLEAVAPVPASDAPAVLPAPAPNAAPALPASSANLSAMRGSGTATPSAQRLTAVRAIVKPETGDAGDDEYSYGFRLWDAKFYPEAQQQLKLTVDKYPRHSRISYARNLLGRAYLDDGKPREAATWFLQNYQSNKNGERAPDSLLYLAESMRQLQDTSRACVALSEFGTMYPAEAAGRLKAQYDQTRNGVKCN